MAPHRRLSAFVHWDVAPGGPSPCPQEICGWLPQYMWSKQWRVPLHAEWVRPAPPKVSQQQKECFFGDVCFYGHDFPFLLLLASPFVIEASGKGKAKGKG